MQEAAQTWVQAEFDRGVEEEAHRGGGEVVAWRWVEQQDDAKPIFEAKNICA